MCDDIGATFPHGCDFAAVDGTAVLIMSRCKSLSAQPTSNLRTARNNISKWYSTLEESEKEQHLNAFEYIMGKIGKALNKRTSLDDL